MWTRLLTQALDVAALFLVQPELFLLIFGRERLRHFSDFAIGLASKLEPVWIRFAILGFRVRRSSRFRLLSRTEFFALLTLRSKLSAIVKESEMALAGGFLNIAGGVPMEAIGRLDNRLLHAAIQRGGSVEVTVGKSDPVLNTVLDALQQRRGLIYAERSFVDKRLSLKSLVRFWGKWALGTVLFGGLIAGLVWLIRSNWQINTAFWVGILATVALGVSIYLSTLRLGERYTALVEYCQTHSSDPLWWMGVARAETLYNHYRMQVRAIRLVRLVWRLLLLLLLLQTFVPNASPMELVALGLVAAIVMVASVGFFVLVIVLGWLLLIAGSTSCLILGLVERKEKLPRVLMLLGVGCFLAARLLSIFEG